MYYSFIIKNIDTVIILDKSNNENSLFFFHFYCSNIFRLFRPKNSFYLFKLDLITILTDLTTNSFTTVQVSSRWDCHSSNSILVSDCPPYHIVGGYNILGANDFCSIALSSLRPHYSLSLSMTFLKIDAWASNTFFLKIDGNVEYSSTFTSTQDAGQRFCPNTINNDAVKPISLNISHVSSSTTINLLTDLTQISTVASWGFRDVIINIDACHISCASCDGPAPTQCLTCFAHAQKINGVCICDTHYYMSYSSPCSGTQCSFCNLCDNSCENCSSAGNQACLSCYSNTYLYNAVCMSQCPDGMYGDSLLLACEVCNSNCLTCSKAATNCTSCLSPLFLFDNKCLTNCNDGYYGNSQQHLCLPCDSKCDTCSYQSTNCTYCAETFYMYTQGNCLSQCPDGKWKNIMTRWCDNCISPCSTCTNSATFCLSCQYPYFLLNNECLLDCPEGTFGDNIKRKCSPCYNSCSTCSGSAQNCTACKIGYVQDYFSCVVICQSGRFLPPYSIICEDCDNNCLTCSESKNTCTSCPKNKFLQNSSCVNNCNANEFFDELFVCHSCDEMCETCKTNANYCTQCTDITLFANDGGCQSFCPISKYTYQPKRQCFLCNETCQGCYGEEYNNCIGCYSGNYLYQNICWNNCPDYTFESGDICMKCGLKCKSCSSFTLCKVCDSGYYVSDNGTCLLQTEIFASLVEVYNPFIFKIVFNFSNSSISLTQAKNNLKIDIRDTIRGNPFQSNQDIQIENDIIYIDISYLELISSFTNISISFTNDSSYNYFISCANSSLGLQYFSQLCSSDYFYDNITKACKQKEHLTFYLKYSTDNINYLILGYFPQKFLTDGEINFFALTISGVTNFTYNIATNGKDANGNEILIISFVFFENIINGPILKAQLNFSIEQIMINHLILENKDSDIKMADYYITTSQEQAISSSANFITFLADIFNTCNLYVNILLNGSSSFLIQGLMLLNLIFMLRFLSINYPPNVSSMFNSRVGINNLFNFPQIAIDEIDKDILPLNFQYYKVSEYFINNTSSNIFLLAFVFIINLLLIMSWKLYKKNCKQNNLSACFHYGKFIFIVLKRMLIWSLLFNMLFSKYQQLFFYTVAGLKFNPNFSQHKGFWNFFSSILSFIFFIFFPFHLYKLLCMMNDIVYGIKSEKKVVPLIIPPPLLKKDDQEKKEKNDFEGFEVVKSMDVSIDLSPKKHEGIPNDFSCVLKSEKPTLTKIKMFASEQFIKNKMRNSLSPQKNLNEFGDEKKKTLVSPFVTVSSERLIPVNNFIEESYRNSKNNFKIVSTNQKSINIQPVEITEEDVLRENWSNVITSSQKQIRIKEEEKFPEIEDLQEVNMAASIREKAEQGSISGSVLKSINYLFQGEPNSGLLNSSPRYLSRHKKSVFSENNNSPRRGLRKLSLFNDKVNEDNEQNEQKDKADCIQVGENNKKKEAETPKKLINFSTFLLKGSKLISPIKNFLGKIYDPNLYDNRRFKKRFFFLWQDFKGGKWIQRFFILFDVARHYLIIFFIINLYGRSFLQILLITICNLCFFVVLLLARPFKKKTSMIISIINECLINIILISVLRLALYETNGDTDPNKRLQLGWIIVFSNLVLMYSLVLLTLCKILQIICKTLSFLRNKKNTSKITPINHENESKKTVDLNKQNQKSEGKIKEKHEGLTIFDLWKF